MSWTEQIDPVTRHAHWSCASASRLCSVLIGCSETRTVSAQLVLNTRIPMRLFIWGSVQFVWCKQTLKDRPGVRRSSVLCKHFFPLVCVHFHFSLFCVNLWFTCIPVFSCCNSRTVLFSLFPCLPISNSHSPYLSVSVPFSSLVGVERIWHVADIAVSSLHCLWFLVKIQFSSHRPISLTADGCSGNKC